MSNTPILAKIMHALNSIHDVYSGGSWAALKILHSHTHESDVLSLVLQFPFPMPADSRCAGVATLETALLSDPRIERVTTEQSVKIKSHAVQPGVAANPAIRNVIAVGSGKGGVGKSTTALNLARALRDAGANVGILDADIYGPNMPGMLGITELPTLTEDKQWLPMMAEGMQSISIGNLVKAETPTIWRGPMVSGAFLQLLNDTLWKNLDYLVVDLPPGTGDVQLTMAKKLPVTASVMVTTPQAVALHDVRKAINMLKKVDVPIAGVIENMSTFVCPHCTQSTDIFSSGGGRALADECSLPFLGSVPLVPVLREIADQGTPLPAGTEDLQEVYRELALRIAAWIAKRPRGYSQHFG